MSWVRSGVLVAVLVSWAFIPPLSSHAQGKKPAVQQQKKLSQKKQPKHSISTYKEGFQVGSFFDDKSAIPHNDSLDVRAEEKALASEASSSSSSSAQSAAAELAAAAAIPTPTVDPLSVVQPPDVRVKPRAVEDAPGSFKGISAAIQDNDPEMAKAYGRQFVQYLTDLMFHVREITRVIGEVLIEQNQIDEESWVGAEQYLTYELAQAGAEQNSPIKITHEDAMRQIKADPKGDVEIYYFFTMSCSWCRKMAPDVERLWRATKSDSRVKMVALTLGPVSKNWIGAYRQHTDLSVPIFNGQSVAKTLRVGFVPAVVVVAPNSKTAYVKTGGQSFARLYEFVRRVQGEPGVLTADLRKLEQTPIGKVEKAKAEGEGRILAAYRFGADPGAGLVLTDDRQQPALQRIGDAKKGSTRESYEKF